MSYIYYFLNSLIRIFFLQSGHFLFLFDITHSLKQSQWKKCLQGKIFTIVFIMNSSWQIEHFSEFDSSIRVIFVSHSIKKENSWFVTNLFDVFIGFCGNKILTLFRLHTNASSCILFSSEDGSGWRNNISFVVLFEVLLTRVISKLCSSDSDNS